EYLRDRQRNRAKAGGLPCLDVAAVAGPGEDAEGPQIVWPDDRFLREEIEPARGRPGEDLEPSPFRQYRQLRMDPVEDVVALAVESEHQGQLQGAQLGEDVRQAPAGYGDRLELAHPHLSDDVGLIPSGAAGVDAQLDRAGAHFAPGLAHLAQNVVVG